MTVPVGFVAERVLLGNHNEVAHAKLVVGEGLAFVLAHELDVVAAERLALVPPPHSEQGAAPIFALRPRKGLDFSLMVPHLFLALQVHEGRQPVGVRAGPGGVLVERGNGNGRGADAAPVEGLHDAVGHVGLDVHRGRATVDVDGAHGVGIHVCRVRDGAHDVTGPFAVQALHEESGHVVAHASAVGNENPIEKAHTCSSKWELRSARDFPSEGRPKAHGSIIRRQF